MDVVYYHLLVLIGVRVHLFPSRTQKLSLLSPTIVAGRLAAKIGNANTITGLPKGGPVFYTCKRWRRLGVDGRWAFGRFLFGGGTRANRQRRRRKGSEQGAAGVRSLFHSQCSFLLLCIGREPHKFYPLPALCSGWRIGNGNGGQNLRLCPSRLYSGAAFVCMCQDFFFDTRTYRFKVAP